MTGGRGTSAKSRALSLPHLTTGAYQPGGWYRIR